MLLMYSGRGRWDGYGCTVICPFGSTTKTRKKQRTTDRRQTTDRTVQCEWLHHSLLSLLQSTVTQQSTRTMPLTAPGLYSNKPIPHVATKRQQMPTRITVAVIKQQDLLYSQANIVLCSSQSFSSHSATFII